MSKFKINDIVRVVSASNDEYINQAGVVISGTVMSGHDKIVKIHFYDKIFIDSYFYESSLHRIKDMPEYLK